MLLASGKFLGVLPLTMLRHPSSGAWLRAVDVDLADSSIPIALISVKKRRAGGAVKLFRQASLGICKRFVERP